MRFSFIKTQMTEALARFGIFMRMETLKVGKPYGKCIRAPHFVTGSSEHFGSLSESSNFPPFFAID